MLGFARLNPQLNMPSAMVPCCNTGSLIFSIIIFIKISYVFYLFN